MFIAKSNIIHDGVSYQKGDNVGKIPQESLAVLVKDGIVELVGKEPESKTDTGQTNSKPSDNKPKP